MFTAWELWLFCLARSEKVLLKSSQHLSPLPRKCAAIPFPFTNFRHWENSGVWVKPGTQLVLNFKWAKTGLNRSDPDFSLGLECLRLVLFFSHKDGQRFTFVFRKFTVWGAALKRAFHTPAFSKYFMRSSEKSVSPANYNKAAFFFSSSCCPPVGRFQSTGVLFSTHSRNQQQLLKVHPFSAHQFSNRVTTIVPRAPLLGSKSICHSWGCLVKLLR